MFGLPVPLVATQLLFVNLLTDAFPAFALGMEGKERGVMERNPRDPDEPIISKDIMRSVAVRSVLVCAGALSSFLYGFFLLEDYAAAVSMCFFTLVASELLIAYPSKTEGASGRGMLANRFLNVSTILSMSILLAVIYIPPLGGLFSVAPLPLPHFAAASAFMLIPVLGSEGVKRLKALRS
jgi:Ca2+-transporting ATPase